MGPSYSTILFELLDAAKRYGCPVCRLARRSAERFFDTLTYENTNDPGIRAMLRKARGFCNRHAWQYTSWRDSLGSAIVYRDVLREILRRLPRESDEPNDPLSRATGRLLSTAGARERDRAVRALSPAGPCIVCDQEAVTSADALDALLARLDEPDVASTFTASGGLCSPHLQLALDLTKQPDRRDRLLAAQQRAWSTLRVRVAAGDVQAAAAALVGSLHAS